MSQMLESVLSSHRCKSSELFEWKRKSEKPPIEEVMSTKMFHKAKGEVRSRIVALEFADGVFTPEHHAGTPPTRALKLVISRMMSKVRTRQFASHDCVSWLHSSMPGSREACG